LFTLITGSDTRSPQIRVKQSSCHSALVNCAVHLFDVTGRGTRLPAGHSAANRALPEVRSGSVLDIILELKDSLAQRHFSGSITIERLRSYLWIDKPMTIEHSQKQWRVWLPAGFALAGAITHASVALFSHIPVDPNTPLHQQDLVNWGLLNYIEFPVAAVVVPFHYLTVYAGLDQVLPVSCDVVFFCFGTLLFYCLGAIASLPRPHRNHLCSIVASILLLPAWVVPLSVLLLATTSEIRGVSARAIMASSSLVLMLCLAEASWQGLSRVARRIVGGRAEDATAEPPS
jgi:hypothetical protein